MTTETRRATVDDCALSVPRLYDDDRARRACDVFGFAPGGSVQMAGDVNVVWGYPGRTVAWHRHTHQTDHWFVIKGYIKVGLMDDDRNVRWVYLWRERPQAAEHSSRSVARLHGAGRDGDGEDVLHHLQVKPGEPGRRANDNRGSWRRLVRAGQVGGRSKLSRCRPEGHDHDAELEPKVHTLEWLESLSRLDYPNFDVLVVDNGSTDGSVKSIRAKFPDVKIVENGENLGYARGFNVGMTHAFGDGADWVLIMNNDTIIDPEGVRALVDVGESDDPPGSCPARYSTTGVRRRSRPSARSLIRGW